MAKAYPLIATPKRLSLGAILSGLDGDVGMSEFQRRWLTLIDQSQRSITMFAFLPSVQGRSADLFSGKLSLTNTDNF
jgi:hypothetical protein